MLLKTKLRPSRKRYHSLITKKLTDWSGPILSIISCAGRIMWMRGRKTQRCPKRRRKWLSIITVRLGGVWWMRSRKLGRMWIISRVLGQNSPDRRLLRCFIRIMSIWSLIWGRSRRKVLPLWDDSKEKKEENQPFFEETIYFLHIFNCSHKQFD